jgi:hypothetical protein
MKDLLNYLIPIAFLLLAAFNLYAGEWLEGALYCSVGIAFPLMWAIRDGKIKNNLKFWNILAWSLVILALFLFFAVLRTDV